MEWTEVAEDLLDRTGIATNPGSGDINGWVRNAPGDRLLSDAEWTGVVEDLMDRTGIRGCDDPVAATGWPSARPATTSTSPRRWSARTTVAGCTCAMTTTEDYDRARDDAVTPKVASG